MNRRAFLTAAGGVLRHAAGNTIRVDAGTLYLTLAAATVITCFLAYWITGRSRSEHRW